MQSLHPLRTIAPLRSASEGTAGGEPPAELSALGNWPIQLRLVPPHAPLIIAGDFNDWRGEACNLLARGLHLTEAFGATHGLPAKSYPAALPLFRLDRIYVRGLQVKNTHVYAGRPWSKISDHAALSAVVAPL